MKDIVIKDTFITEYNISRVTQIIREELDRDDSLSEIGKQWHLKNILSDDAIQIHNNNVFRNLKVLNDIPDYRKKQTIVDAISYLITGDTSYKHTLQMETSLSEIEHIASGYYPGVSITEILLGEPVRKVDAKTIPYSDKLRLEDNKFVNWFIKRKKFIPHPKFRNFFNYHLDKEYRLLGETTLTKDYILTYKYHNHEVSRQWMVCIHLVMNGMLRFEMFEK